MKLHSRIFFFGSKKEKQNSYLQGSNHLRTLIRVFFFQYSQIGLSKGEKTCWIKQRTNLFNNSFYTALSARFVSLDFIIAVVKTLNENDRKD